MACPKVAENLERFSNGDFPSGDDLDNGAQVSEVFVTGRITGRSDSGPGLELASQNTATDYCLIECHLYDPAGDRDEMELPKGRNSVDFWLWTVDPDATHQPNPVNVLDVNEFDSVNPDPQMGRFELWTDLTTGDPQIGWRDGPIDGTGSLVVTATPSFEVYYTAKVQWDGTAATVSVTPVGGGTPLLSFDLTLAATPMGFARCFGGPQATATSGFEIRLDNAFVGAICPVTSVPPLRLTNRSDMFSSAPRLAGGSSRQGSNRVTGYL